jgi:hypothetical protein
MGIDDLLRRTKELEERKPRINCPTHGYTLICAKCRKCLSCIWDDGKAWQLEWCLKERHTFLNLWAPCKFCRGQGGTGATHTWEESKCNPCWRVDYDAYHKRQREEARRKEEARKYAPYITSPPLEDDDYYPDYEGEDLEDAED